MTVTENNNNNNRRRTVAALDFNLNSPHTIRDVHERDVFGDERGTESSDERMESSLSLSLDDDLSIIWYANTPPPQKKNL